MVAGSRPTSAQWRARISAFAGYVSSVVNPCQMSAYSATSRSVFCSP